MKAEWLAGTEATSGMDRGAGQDAAIPAGLPATVSEMEVIRATERLGGAAPPRYRRVSNQRRRQKIVEIDPANLVQIAATLTAAQIGTGAHSAATDDIAQLYYLMIDALQKHAPAEPVRKVRARTF